MERDNSCVRGDEKAMPNRGTRTNVPGNVASNSRDLGPKATNRLGDAHTAPTPAMDNTPNGE